MIPITFKFNDTTSNTREGAVAFETKCLTIPTIGSCVSWPEHPAGMWVKFVEYHYESKLLVGLKLAAVTVWLVKGRP